MKKIQCARCGRDGVPYFIGTLWCKTDGLYFCRRCFSHSGNKCPKCNGKIKNKPATLLFYAVAFLLVMTITVTFIPGELNDMMFWGELKDINPTPIDNVPLDEKVVIIGVVESSNLTPLQGFEHDDDEDFYFRSDTFLLKDDSGNITVEVDPDVTFGRWAHKNTDDDLNRYWFENGDGMVIVGKVSEDDEGNRTIKAVVITESYSDFKDRYDFSLNFIRVILIIISFLSSLILISIVWTKKRIPVHEQNYSGPMIPTEVITRHTSHVSPSANTEWIQNPRFNQRIKWLWFWGVITAIILGIMVWLFLNGLDLGWLAVAWLPIFIPGMSFILLFVDRNDIPTYLGFDDRGFHFKYARPNPKKERLRSVEWKDIATMLYYTHLTDHMLKIIFKDKDSEEVGLVTLNESLIKEILERFNNKEARIGVKRTVTTKVEPVGDIPWERPQAAEAYPRNISLLVILSAIVLISFIVGNSVYMLVIIPIVSIFLALLLYGNYLSIPAWLAITPKGIYLKNRKGKEEFLNYNSWDTVALKNNNLVINLKSGTVRVLQELSLNEMGSVLRSFVKYKGLKTERKAAQNLPVNWYENPAYGYYDKLMKLSLVGAIVTFIVITYSEYLAWDPDLIFLYIFGFMVAIPYIIIKRIIFNTPTRIGFSKNGIHLGYPSPFDNISPSFVPFTDIVGLSGLVTPKQDSKLSRMKDNEIIIITKYGRFISIEPLDYDNVNRYLDCLNNFHHSLAGEKWLKNISNQKDKTSIRIQVPLL